MKIWTILNLVIHEKSNKYTANLRSLGNLKMQIRLEHT